MGRGIHFPGAKRTTRQIIGGLVPVTATSAPFDPARYAELEAGNLLFFSESPTRLSEEDRSLLLGQRQSGAAYHKNIAYRPSQDVLTGVARSVLRSTGSSASRASR